MSNTTHPAAEADVIAIEVHKLIHILKIVNDEIIYTATADDHSPVLMEIGIGIARDVENRLDELVARLSEAETNS